MATNPKLLLLDEIAGGLTDAECQSLIETIKAIHAEGVTIIWIEHVLHALNSRGRTAAGARFRQGHRDRRARRRSWNRRSQRDLSGDRGMSAPDHPRAHRPLRRFPGAVRRRYRPRTKARPSPSSAPTARARRRSCGRSPAFCRMPRQMITLDGKPIGGMKPPMRSWPGCRDGARGAAAVPVALGRGEPADRQYGRKVPAAWTLETIYELFPSSRNAATIPAPRFRAVSSRWWRSAAR
jgi:hypothetical protein